MQNSTVPNQTNLHPMTGWWGVVVVVVLSIMVRFWIAGRLGLAEDEAYYWAWSQQLAGGYFDHPPAVAWVIRAGTWVLGDTEQGVRLVGLLLGGLVIFLAADLAKDRLLAALTLAFMPLMALGGLLATPDVVLVAAWTLGIHCAARDRWIGFGVAVGLAMMSKYTGVLLWPLVFVARWELRKEWGPWVALGVATLIVMPNVWWNMQHDWVSYLFQLNHVATSADSWGFVAAQIGLAGPIAFLVFVAWWATAMRRPQFAQDPLERICWWSSLPVLAIAVWAGGEANWAAPAFVGPAIAIARRVNADERRWRRGGWVGVGVSAVLSTLVLVHSQIPLFNLADDPVHRLRGGKELGESVRGWGMEEVWTNRYQEAGLIHFYGGVEAKAWPGLGRPSQYDIWSATIEPKQGLFVRVWRGGASLQMDKEEMGLERSGPNAVTAYAPTNDPLLARPVARWQVYEFWPKGSR